MGKIESNILYSLENIEERIKNTSDMFNHLVLTVIKNEDAKNQNDILGCIITNINTINDDLEDTLAKYAG